jgi:hypothetical protein
MRPVSDRGPDTCNIPARTKSIFINNVDGRFYTARNNENPTAVVETYFSSNILIQLTFSVNTVGFSPTKHKLITSNKWHIHVVSFSYIMSQ